ncbi:hypothetical protein V8C34DRAFT_279856 [Trichoderma compactum]
MRLKIPGFWSCLFGFLLLFLFLCEQRNHVTSGGNRRPDGCEILCCARWLFSAAPFHLQVCRGTSHQLALDLRTGVNHVKARNRQVEMLIPGCRQMGNTRSRGVAGLSNLKITLEARSPQKRTMPY